MKSEITVQLPKLVQASFDKITMHEGEYCFHLNTGQHSLQQNDVVEIEIHNGKKEYKKIHYVGRYTGDSACGAFTIDGDLMLIDKDKKLFTVSELQKNNASGTWTLINNVELSISNCSTKITEVFLDYKFENVIANFFRNMLFKIQERRIFASNKIPDMCTEEYLKTVLNFSKADIQELDLHNTQMLNIRLANIYNSYVNYDHRIVRFEDNFIITPTEYPVTYYWFLMLSLVNAEIINANEILNYHLAKHSDKRIFYTALKAHYRNLPDVLKNEDLKDSIWEWIDDTIKQNNASELIQGENERVNGRVNEHLMRVSERVNEGVTRVNERVSERVMKSDTRQFIANELNAIDRMGWSYLFESESDYNAFLDLLTGFFDNTPYSIPDKTIRLKKGCLTRLGKVLRPIHKKLNGGGLMDIKFFDILRKYNHFEGFSNDKMLAVMSK